MCGAVAGMGLLSGVGIEYSCCDVKNCGGVWMERSARPNWLSGLAICWSKGGSDGCLAWRPKATMKHSGFDRVMAGDAGTVYGLAARDLGGASLLLVGRIYGEQGAKCTCLRAILGGELQGVTMEAESESTKGRLVLDGVRSVVMGNALAWD